VAFFSFRNTRLCGTSPCDGDTLFSKEGELLFAFPPSLEKRVPSEDGGCFDNAELFSIKTLDKHKYISYNVHISGVLPIDGCSLKTLFQKEIAACLEAGRLFLFIAIANTIN